MSNITKERKGELMRLLGCAMREAVYKYGLDGATRNEGERASIFLYSRSGDGKMHTEVLNYTFVFLCSFANQHLLTNHISANIESAARRLAAYKTGAHICKPASHGC